VKKYSVIALALLSLAGLSATARAEDGNVAIAVPFEFVAGGQTLPSGTYTISSTSSGSSALILSGRGHSVLLFAAGFNDYSDLNKARLSFQNVDGKNLLSEVTTSAGIYTIVTQRELTRLAQMQRSGMTSSGTN